MLLTLSPRLILVTILVDVFVVLCGMQSGCKLMLL